VTNSSGFVYRDGSGKEELFNSSLQLSQIKINGVVNFSLTYDISGRLESVVHWSGRRLLMQYDATTGLLTNLTKPDLSKIHYTYTSWDLVETVAEGSLPPTVTYAYEDAIDPYLLTRIKGGDSQTFKTYQYTKGKVTSSTIGQQSNFAYNYNIYSTFDYRVTTIKFPGGGENTRYSELKGDRLQTTRNTWPTDDRLTYDSSGNLISAQEYIGNGSKTCIWYAPGTTLETIRIEGTSYWTGCTTAYSMSDVQLGKAQRTTTEWHATLRKPIRISSHGLVRDYGYDSHGNLLTETITDSTASPSTTRTQSWTYDAQNQITSHTDEADQTSSYTYNAAGFMNTAIDPRGKVTSYTHDGAGRLTRVTTPDGLVQQYTYDTQGRLQTSRRGVLATTMAYYPTGLLESVTQPSGYQVTYEYNAAHRMTGWSDNRGNRGDYVLDNAGNRTGETIKDNAAQLAFELQRTINAVNKVATETVGTSQSTSFKYDMRLSLTSQANALNQTTTYGIDDLKRVTQITNPLSKSATLSYNQLDAITQAKDFKGVATNYTRDALGNAKDETSPDAGSAAASYDVRGLLASITDATGRTIGVERDALARITQLNYDNGSASVLRYDLPGAAYNSAAAPNASVGHLSEVQDPGVTTQYQRDSLGRVLRKSQILQGGETRSIGYSYVPAGQGGAGSVQTITYPSGKQLSYQYDSTGLITGLMWDGAPLVTHLAWSPLGMPTGWSWQGIASAPGSSTALAEARSYNTAGQLTHTSILDLTWNAAGRISAIEQSQMVPGADSAGGPATTTAQPARIATAYTYDAAGRLTASAHSLKASPAVLWPKVGTIATGLLDTAGYTSMGYAYDANGNRLSASITRTPAAGSAATTTRSYSLGAGSNLLASVSSITNPGATGSTVAYQYDASGALTSATGPSAHYLHYNRQGRVAKVTSSPAATAPQAVSYLYNSASQRLLKTDTRQSTSAPRTEHTLYSDADSAQLLGTYSNQRSASSAAPAGEMDSTEILYLPTAQGLVPIAAQINGQLYAIHTDHLSTPRRLTNAQGQVAWQWLLTGFGEVSPTTAAQGYVQPGSAAAGSLPSYGPEVTFDLRYPGQQWDEESGLAFNINRYYDKTSGRYIQADPIGLDGGWNRFGYVGGNPLNAVDPEGLQATRTPLPPVSYGQTLLNIQGISLTREIQRYQPSYTYSYISGQGQGYTASNILRLQSTLFRIQQSGVCTSGNGPIAGGGAYISNITPQEILRIQNAVDRTNTTISVVGSRANGSAGPLSDWDYVVPPGTPRRTIHSMSSSLPEGHRSIGERRNQDFFDSAVNPNLPYITFNPRK